MHDSESFPTSAIVIILQKEFRDGKLPWAEGHKNNHYKEPLISGDQLRTGPILSRYEFRDFSIARVNKWQKITWPWGPVQIYDRKGGRTQEERGRGVSRHRQSLRGGTIEN